MKTVAAVTLAIVLLGIAELSPAANVWHTAKIEKIYPFSDGSFVLAFASDSPVCTNINSPKYYWVRVGANGVTELGLKNMLSVAMFAAAVGLDVSLYFDDSSSSCFVNRLQARVD